MKKISTIFAALLFLAAWSCSREEMPAGDKNSNESGKEETNLISVTFDAGKEATSLAEGASTNVTTRSYVDGKSINWEDTDEVLVYDDISPADPQTFSVAVGEPATTAELSGEIHDGAVEFYAVSPSVAGSGLSGNTLEVTLPASQTIASGKQLDNKALISVAHATKGSAFEFKNVCGFLQVEVTYSNVKAITVSGSKISGTVKVDGSTGVIADNSSASNEITLTHEGGVFPRGVYYIPVLPGTTAADGFIVSLTQDIAGFSATRTASQEVEIPRNGGFDFKELDSSLSWQYLIGNADELVAWNNRYAEWKATDVVKLTGDINMAGQEWTPHTFTGTFDGQSHNIYNITVSTTSGYCGFFAEMSGSASLKNLIVGRDPAGDKHDDVSVFTQNSTRTDSGVYDFVALVGKVSGTTSISYVTNYAKMTYGAAATPLLFRAAGICAQWGSTGECKNNINHGEITVEATGNATSQGGSLAGIISFTNKSGIVIESCENRGKIHSSHRDIQDFGGILGKTNNPIKLSSCNNHGQIESSNTSVNNINIGGICGYDTGGSEYDTCKNLGVINDVSKASELSMAGIIGLVTAAGNIHGCENSGPITKSSNSSAYAYIGGIIGQNNTAAIGTLKNCNNLEKGEISIAGPGGRAFMGGIIGYVYNVTTNLEYCHNYAPVSSSGEKSVSYPYFGGIVGAYDATGAHMSDCNNYGIITVGTQLSTEYNRIGGLAGSVNNASLTFSNCVCKANISYANTADQTCIAGGLIGALRSNGHEMSDCKYFGTVAGATSMGALAGTANNAKVGSVKTTLKNNGAGGMIGTTPIGPDNFDSLLYTTTHGVTTTGNFLWNGETN